MMIRKISPEQSINFWDTRSKLAYDSLSKVMWPDRPVWNNYIDNLQVYYLNRYISKLKPSDMVLDIGCGVGRFSFRFAGFCKEVYGIDSSRENIKFAINRKEKSNLDNIKFQIMDMRNLKFKNEAFDYIFSIVSICHITDKNDFVKTIKELIRVLKNDGHIIFLENTIISENYISISKNEWFKIIEECGGKIDYWCGIDIPFLRKVIIDLPFRLICHFITRKNWEINGDIIEKDKKILELYSQQSQKNKFIENSVMRILTNLIKPLEYTLPKILKNQSMYVLVEISKK